MRSGQPPKGGHHVWVTFRRPLDERALMTEALRQGVSFTPGGATTGRGRRPVRPAPLVPAVRRARRSMRASAGWRPLSAPYAAQPAAARDRSRPQLRIEAAGRAAAARPTAGWCCVRRRSPGSRRWLDGRPAAGSADRPVAPGSRREPDPLKAAPLGARGRASALRGADRFGWTHG